MFADCLVLLSSLFKSEFEDLRGGRVVAGEGRLGAAGDADAEPGRAEERHAGGAMPRGKAVWGPLSPEPGNRQVLKNYFAYPCPHSVKIIEH